MIVEYKIDTSHFLDPKKAGFLRSGINKKKHWSETLVSGHKDRIASKIIRRALIESGEVYVCKKCGIGPEWENEELTLHVDHIDQNRHNSVKENLRFLCPNCHSQAKPYVGSKCENCHKKITSKSNWCKRCYPLFRNQERKVKNRPSLETILEDVDKLGFTGTGKKYGVSDNTIRKWIKFANKLNENCKFDPE